MNETSSVRKLAVIDILFLGFKFALAEYVCGVLLSIALGIFVLFRRHTSGQVAFGIYLISLGINYVPMVLYTLFIANKVNAAAELGDELNEKNRAMSKYRRLSLVSSPSVSDPRLKSETSPALVGAGFRVGTLLACACTKICNRLEQPSLCMHAMGSTIVGADF